MLLQATLAVATHRAASAQLPGVGPKLPAETGASAETMAACLTQQVDAQELFGVVACMSDRYDTRTVAAGQSGNGRPLDADSVFEVGSITKVFTALLMANMVSAGEIAVSDPVAKYLPPEARPREYDGKPITLLDLATHTSGLPRLPNNFRPRDQANPYADYTVAKTYDALSTTTPLRYPGSHFEYSNLGFGLLGHVLSLRGGRSYEELVEARICKPLGLDDTRVTLTPDMRTRLTVGHDAALNSVPNWEFGSFPGAGAIRSTVNDMRRLVECCLGREASPIQPWLATMLDVRRQADPSDEAAAAGWFVQTAHSDELVWKDGDTGGYSSFIGYSTRTGIGSVVLSNTQNSVMVPALGRTLINSGFPNPVPRKRFVVDPAKLKALAGRYDVLPGFVLTVRPQGPQLMVQATNQAEYPVFADSDTTFHYTVVDAQLTFEIGADGQAMAVTLHQHGREMRGARQSP